MCLLAMVAAALGATALAFWNLPSLEYFLVGLPVGLIMVPVVRFLRPARRP